MKVQFFKSHLMTGTGMGESALNFLKFFQQNKIEVILYNDIKRSFRVENVTYSEKLIKDIPLIYYTQRYNNYEVLPRHLSIVRSMFENDRLPENWVTRFNPARQVWVPSMFNLETYAKAGVDKNRLFVIREPVDSNEVSDQKYSFKTQKKFKFLSIFDWKTLYRKGVDVLLKAYLEAFSNNDDVCLVIKTGVSKEELFQKLKIKENKKHPEIELINARLNDQEMLSLYNSVDSYVLTSRGEGIGRPYLYAMLKKLPVIATGWSGNTEFMNDDNSFLIKFNLKSVPNDLSKTFFPQLLGGMLAEPNVAHLKETMFYVVNNTKEAKKRGVLARKEILENHSYKQVLKDIHEALSVLKDTKSIPKPINLFYRLVPVSFPNKKKEFDLQHSIFSNGIIKKAAVFGTGVCAKMAFKWLKKFPELKEIVFLTDVDEHPKYFLEKSVYHYKAIDQNKFDILIIACVPDCLRFILKKLENSVKIPVYCFY